MTHLIGSDVCSIPMSIQVRAGISTIELADQQTSTASEIYDITGRFCIALEAQRRASGVVRVPVEKLSNGVYRYHVSGTNEVGRMTVLH